jgi:hypothetical protein
MVSTWMRPNSRFHASRLPCLNCSKSHPGASAIRFSTAPQYLLVIGEFDHHLFSGFHIEIEPRPDLVSGHLGELRDSSNLRQKPL